MTICIPIGDRPEGGMYTFLAAFRRFLDDARVPYTGRLDEAFDVLFVNSWAVGAEIVRGVKRDRPGITVVQRVDGSARDYGRGENGDPEQARVNLFADLTIFQSRYSRYSVREKFKVIAQDGPVIYNPVDLDRFSPEGPARDLPGTIRVVTVAWSTNRGKGTWQINRLAAENPDVDFIVCGRFDEIGSPPNVRRLGYVPQDELPPVLRSCHAFLNLSENDPCPNVVIEALASGLPVVYRDSGGVPELVGDCGTALDASGFRAALDDVLARRAALGAAARARAEEMFAPAAIFPQYLDAIGTTVRRSIPSPAEIDALAAAGYPVVGPTEAPLRKLVRTALDRGPAMVRSVVRGLREGGGEAKRFRIGWVTHDSFPARKRRFEQLEPFTRMRVGRVAEWINAHSRLFHNELYRPGARYDVVVFQKMMDARCQREAERVRASGGRVIFDANVNYYEIWGDYFVPGTKPTPEQQADATWMTRFADHVVADSSYLAELVRPINPAVTWIPDNVSLDVYGAERVHTAHTPVRVVWSGIAQKGAHLLDIAGALGSVPDLQLVIVADRRPDFMPALEAAVPCELVVGFSDERYASILAGCDVIVSPKRLCNGYELGHTEYKIALGMAVGLPAVASRQQSYVEALSRGGGFIVDSLDEWRGALARLAADAALRAEQGARARRTIIDHYSTSVVALRYAELLASLVPAREGATA